MTDREILELAAKAAGEEVMPGFNEQGDIEIRISPRCGQWWNPLTDDGDALRLAVKLHIDVLLRHPSLAQAIGPAPAQAYADEPRGTNPYAATRRAIVRAAAAIGAAAIRAGSGDSVSPVAGSE